MHPVEPTAASNEDLKSKRPWIYIAFWIAFLISPLIFGLLEYRWLRDESFDPKRHELISGVDVGTRYEEKGVRPMLWRSKETLEVFSPGDFAEHRTTERYRLTVVWFGYGLLACLAFSLRALNTGSQPFLQAIGASLLGNTAIAAYIFLST